MLLHFSSIFYLVLMDISSGQSVMQEISQKHSQHATIKEVLKLVTLSELLQQNSCEMWSNFDVSVIFF